LSLRVSGDLQFRRRKAAFEKRTSAMVAGRAATMRPATSPAAELNEEQGIAGEREDVLNELEALGDDGDRGRGAHAAARVSLS
jgi:hypothetical protein